MSFNGGRKSPFTAGWRTYANQDTQELQPEKSTNWSLGFDYAPSNFLKGLDLQATWYLIKINNLLVGFGNPTTTRFSDGSIGFAYIVPSDLRDPVTNVQLCAGKDATPWLCPQFQDMILRAINLPNNAIPPTAQTLLYWLNDGGTRNTGWQKNEGIDYSASYDFDVGTLGAFNLGIIGTYYLHVNNQRIPGVGEPVDGYHDDLPALNGYSQLGVVSPRPRSRYRTRVGWSNGSWDATMFMNYDGHFYHTQTAPPNVNDACLTAGGTIGGGTFPCLITAYNNEVPSYYTFDLSIGYNTGDSPANDYLRNIGIQLTVDNIMDRQPAFEYRISTGGGNPSAFDILKNLYGRLIGVRVTKTW